MSSRGNVGAKERGVVLKISYLKCLVLVHRINRETGL